jgi:hypothetical protein
MSTANTIALLRKVIKDPVCGRMNMSTIKGFLGELIVKERLEDAGFEVDHRGNQSGYDLSFWSEDQEFRIDVKTSTLKDELSCGRLHWGWALVHSNKRKAVSATHFMCVGLDESFEARRFILIPSEWAGKFPAGIGQFNRVKHALCAFQRAYAPQDLAPQKMAYIVKCQKWLRHRPIKQLSKGQSFRSIFC